MEAFFQSGALIDAILILLVFEALAFLVLFRSLPSAPRLATPHVSLLWPQLLSGAFLMLAVRLAVTQASWIWIASLLALSGIAHVYDIAQRFRLARVD